MLLYIDPGTGSMLFTILMAVIGAGFYAVGNLVMKLQFIISGGQEKMNVNKIPFVIFSDSKRYWNTFESICDEFEKIGQPLTYMTASEDDPALQKKYQYVECEFIGEGNRAFAKLNLLNAGVLLSTTPGLDVYQWKRSKNVDWYVHIPHAPSDITLYRMFGLDYYDAVLTSGRFQIDQIRQLEKVRNIKAKELLVAGLPYLDGMKKRLNNSEVKKKEERTVLLAPSWGESAILSRYGGKIIEGLLKSGYHIIIRPHPQSFTSERDMIETLMKQYPDSEQMEWNQDNDNFDALSRSDILISDFSGVIFDYAFISDKPVIYADTSFDDAPYDSCWLEEETWTFRVLPKIGRKLNENDIQHIKQVIDDCIADQGYAKARRIAKEEAWQNEGKGAEHIVKYMIETHHKIEDHTRGQK